LVVVLVREDALLVALTEAPLGLMGASELRLRLRVLVLLVLLKALWV
jgi:hypothetical protein